MRNGHYTKSDITDLRIIERDKEKNIAREVMALVDGYSIRSYGLKEVYINQIKSLEQEKRYLLANVPAKFSVIAELVEKKASGHGGRRAGSGAKKSGKEIKKTRSIRMTDYEYKKVQEFLFDLRLHESREVNQDGD